MFKAEIRSDTLKSVVNIISTLIDEVKFTVDQNGMELKAVDPAHVAMIEMQIKSGAFESFSADNTEIGVDLDKIKDVLKLAGASDVISIELDEDRGKLIFKVGNITRRMNLVDTSSMGETKVPQLDLSASVTVPVSELQRGIKASESISDHIALTANEAGFSLSCEGDTDSVDLVLDKSVLSELEVKSEVRSIFPLDYFSNLVKAVPSDLSVTISLDTDFPVKINFDMADGNGTVRYLLAPRIEND